MKALAIVAVIIILAVGGLYWYGNVYVAKDHGHLIAYACGNPYETSLDINAAVSIPMMDLDPPKLQPDGTFQTKNEWVADHLELRSDDGVVITLAERDSSDLIPKGQVGTPAFYLLGMIEQNTTYTFDYYPKGRARSKPYRHTFTTTDTGKPFERARFLP